MPHHTLLPPLESTDVPLRRPRILVVDDQPLNVQAIYQAFAADHQVLMATDGERALALCAEQLPDLVLLDVMMPGMDGFEVCRRLKADAALRDTPVIFVTARDDVEAEAKGLELGGVDFISKPVNPKIVRARVKAQLTLKAQADLLRQLAYVDGLTGVYNRRYFDERLARELARAVRGRKPLCVLLLDVDFFKRYNDRYGHQAGDDALQRIAACLREGLRRPGDLVARYGGEEFVCLLADTELEGACALAEGLRERIFALGIEHAASSVAPTITVSLGVACKSPDSAPTAAALLQEADAQLYLAKALGRHRLCGAPCAPPLGVDDDLRKPPASAADPPPAGPGARPLELASSGP